MHLIIVLTNTFGIECMYPFKRSKIISPRTPAMVARLLPRQRIASITKIWPKCRKGVPTAAGRGMRKDWIPRKMTAAKNAVITREDTLEGAAGTAEPANELFIDF